MSKPLHWTQRRWTQWVCPGPTRVFTPDELQRGGSAPWPKEIEQFVYFNMVALAALNYPAMRGYELALTALASFGAAAAILAVARWLWRVPSRWRLNLASLMLGGMWVALALNLVAIFTREERKSFQTPLLIAGVFCFFVVSAWWVLTVYRADQIEARLRELAEQEKALRLTRRLATAQIQPHFLFNTLASLQHWVATQDERAAPMLQSFTNYLRATLPMFDHESIPLVQELHIVRSYLEVMQARLGARLTWSINADPALDALAVPAGALLTLAENAITHAIEPALRGGSVQVRALRAAPNAPAPVWLEVQDDGPGPGDTAEKEGLGLSNTRERLQQLYGAAAVLSLRRAAPGCLARIAISDEAASKATPKPTPPSTP